MLSWSFVAATLILVVVPPGLSPRTRAALLAAVSIITAAALWAVPVLPLLGGALAVYGVGRALPRLAPRPRAALLAAAIAAVVAVLAWCKADAAPGATLAGATTVLGLSYLALKLIQHLADAADGRAASVDLASFLATIFFLPTYPAGPIERTTDFTRKLRDGAPGWMERALGLERIVVGLGKKFLLADPLLGWATPVLHAPRAAAPAHVLGAIDAFALALYFDFAGYSDLAIGVARLAGIAVRENFDSPYLRRNLALLWQHWHMSLTGWLRDFVFVPSARRLLRATRRPLASQVGAQTVTMLACGLWHGLAWNYVVWGAYQAVGLGALACWRSWRGPAPADAPLRHAVSTVATFQFFALGLVLFACDVPRAATVIGRVLGLAV